jgi:hypothetical protein
MSGRFDCSSFFPREVDGAAMHGAYFVNEGTLNLMCHVLRGFDRGVLDRLGYTKGAAWPGAERSRTIKRTGEVINFQTIRIGHTTK